MRTKYRKGKCINSRAELLALLDAGKWVYYDGRPRHPSFYTNWKVKTLDALISVGAFFEAVEKDGKQPASGTVHRSPKSHAPQWILDRENFARCQYPGCRETKQFPSRAEVEDNLAKHRNYKNKRIGGTHG